MSPRGGGHLPQMAVNLLEFQFDSTFALKRCKYTNKILLLQLYKNKELF
jgi:hypothetical protein